MSVLPRDVLLQLLPNIHLKPPTQVAQAFSGQQLLLEGPYHLMVTICQYTFCHPFYALDDHDPTIVGMDFINAAQLVIDCRQGYVWSYYTRGSSTSGDSPTSADDHHSHHTSPKYPVSTLDSTVTSSLHTGIVTYDSIWSTVTAPSHTGSSSTTSAISTIPLCVHEHSAMIPTAIYNRHYVANLEPTMPTMTETHPLSPVNVPQAPQSYLVRLDPANSAAPAASAVPHTATVAPVTPSPPPSTLLLHTAPTASTVAPVTPSPSPFSLLPDTALAASNLARVTPSTIDVASLPAHTDNPDVALAHILNPQAVEFNPQHSTTNPSCVYP